MMNALPTTFIASPCTGVCRLDDDQICLGCFRSLHEIAQWSQMTASQQIRVIAGLKARREYAAIKQGSEQ
jgi:predicted Fe-S protein YdhL (DUF1289 family)